MRACPGMAKKRADAICGLGRENMLELAGLLGDFFFVLNVKGLSKEPLRQPMAADHVFCPLAALLGEDDHVVAVAGVIACRTERDVAAI